ncbi:hypothetical protein, partial [Bacillus thuringiensis]|uniref:hypothetical protein n=1 Tax=Bacillus thuringiensis TaxID=1428 RepID=UPI0020BD6FA2
QLNCICFDIFIFKRSKNLYFKVFFDTFFAIPLFEGMGKENHIGGKLKRTLNLIELNAKSE